MDVLLKIDQAEADKRVAQAKAEERRALAVALRDDHRALSWADVDDILENVVELEHRRVEPLDVADREHASCCCRGVHDALCRGQVGRKAGAGFYRMIKRDDGSRAKEVFDLVDGSWRP